MQQYQVTGMSCAACQARVEKAVSKVPGVKSVAVSLLTNSMGVEGEADPKAVIEAVQKAGYGASLKTSANASSNAPSPAGDDLLRDTETPKLVRRLILSAGFLLVLMYVSMGHNMWGFPLPSYFEHNHLGLTLTQMILALIVMYINRKFFESGIRSLLHGAPNMDTLVALGSGVSFLWSLFVFFKMCGLITTGTANADLHELYHNQLYFESAAMIPALITVGKTLESVSKGRTTDSLKSLMKLAPKTARVLRHAPGSETSCDGVSACDLTSDLVEQTIPIEEVVVGDLFAVKPGESIPVDGVVLDGESAVDESALTGESIPVDKAAGAKVSAATINRSGYLRCRATRVGQDTTLSQIIKMVSDAAATKAPIARIADKVSAIFVPTVIGIAIFVTAAWLLARKDASFALARGISVLVISCPCALGLATPVAIMVGNGVGAKNGVLFKTGEALEEMGKATIVAMDKTGTITSGKPKVHFLKGNGIAPEELLSKANALELKSEHPLARAIVSAFEDPESDLSLDREKLRSYDVTDFSVHPGHGLEGKIDSRTIHGGKKEYIEQFTKIDRASEDEKDVSKRAMTALYFEEDGNVLGAIWVADTIREDSKDALTEMGNLGITKVMLTGDNEKAAEGIPVRSLLDRVVANILPDRKAGEVKKLQRDGKVIMVGDGINDAPALKTADIGVAIGAGTDVAIDSADVVLVNNSIRDVAAAIRLSRKTMKNIYENLFWAFFYNVICIPIAAGVLPWKMNPMIGAAAMSISSFTVCMNALRLNLFNMHDASRDKAPRKTHPANKNIPEPERRSSTMKKTLKIEGMMCEHCEASVKKALEALPFIATAIPNHNTNSCAVELSDESAWDEALVKATIEGKDYKYLGEE